MVRNRTMHVQSDLCKSKAPWAQTATRIKCLSCLLIGSAALLNASARAKILMIKCH